MMEQVSSLSENRVTYASGSNRSSGATEARKQTKRVTEANALKPGRSDAATGFFCYRGSDQKLQVRLESSLNFIQGILPLQIFPNSGR
jgi:hypothetical protein